jgi:hypothetical protein
LTGDPRAFVALDQGAASTSAALIGRVDGRWRLLGAARHPAGIPVDIVLDTVVERFADADPELAAELDVVAAAGWARVATTSAKPGTLGTVAVSERALEPLARAAAKSGWRLRTGSAEKSDPLAMTGQLLDPAVDAVLVGAGEPPGADERGTLGDLAALVAGVASRRPELTIVLAGAMAEQAPRFESSPDRPGEVLLGAAATAGRPPGSPLRELLERIRTDRTDSRRAFAVGIQTLAESVDRRVEGIEVGLDGASRVSAAPARGDDPPSLHEAIVATAGLVPPELDEGVVEGVLNWSTAPFDRHRMRDRLRDLREMPWGDVVGEGAPLRLAAARAAVARLLAATREFDALPVPDLLVVSGGAWAVAPGPAIALAVADVVRRPGATQIAFDHAGLLAAIGAIEDPDDRRALARDLSGDLLAPLGSVVMPQGMRSGRSGGRLVVHGTSGSSEIDLVPGGLELVDLPPGESAVAEFEFRDSVRLATRGRHFAVDVAGGLGGLLVDLRDVPLRLPDRADRRRELLSAWQAALWAGLES